MCIKMENKNNLLKQNQLDELATMFINICKEKIGGQIGNCNGKDSEGCCGNYSNLSIEEAKLIFIELQHNYIIKPKYYPYG